jgi:hypothetical protein
MLMHACALLHVPTLVVHEQFPLYERLKAAARNRRRRITGDITARESPLELVAASACSKLASSCITYPHEVRNDGTVTL